MLLVLDNWEHLLDSAEVINTILREAPSVKVLATSREKLNLSSEYVYPLGGLRFREWDSFEDALEDDAVQLLVQSAHRANRASGWCRQWPVRATFLPSRC